MSPFEVEISTIGLFGFDGFSCAIVQPMPTAPMANTSVASRVSSRFIMRADFSGRTVEINRTFRLCSRAPDALRIHRIAARLEGRGAGLHRRALDTRAPR